METEEPTQEEFKWDWKTGHRSVSQLKEYSIEHDGCPYRWYLHRVERKWQKPAAWSPQGTGVHKVGEEYERSGRTLTLEQAFEIFDESYMEEINKLTAETPNFKMWFRSGGWRRSVEDDIERRWGIGYEQVEKYIDYYKERPEEKVFVTEDGTLAVELPFRIDFDGVEVIGYIDQVVWDPIEKRWVVRDIKTGKTPGDEMQLAVYGVVMEEDHGLVIDYGDYWMAVSGKPTFPYDLTDWPKSRLSDEFGAMDQGVKEERFDPNPSLDRCKMCSVNWACEFRMSENF
jgi:putative RecB family exonuclease